MGPHHDIPAAQYNPVGMIAAAHTFGGGGHGHAGDGASGSNFSTYGLAGGDQRGRRAVVPSDGIGCGGQWVQRDDLDVCGRPARGISVSPSSFTLSGRSSQPVTLSVAPGTTDGSGEITFSGSAGAASASLDLEFGLNRPFSSLDQTSGSGCSMNGELPGPRVPSTNFDGPVFDQNACSVGGPYRSEILVCDRGRAAPSSWRACIRRRRRGCAGRPRGSCPLRDRGVDFLNHGGLYLEVVVCVVVARVGRRSSPAIAGVQ